MRQNQPIGEQASSSHAQSNWQELEIFQAHNVAPQELVVESLPKHLNCYPYDFATCLSYGAC